METKKNEYDAIITAYLIFSLFVFSALAVMTIIYGVEGRAIMLFGIMGIIPILFAVYLKFKRC